MACGGAAARSSCLREVRFAVTGRDTGDCPPGSMELSRRARLQPEVLAGAGDGSRRRRSSGRGAEFMGHRSSCRGFEPNYDPDGGQSGSDSAEDSSASSDDENVCRQRRLLQDALFGFFKKQAIKSLKRDFSKFCHNANFSYENKRLKAPGIGRDAFSVYSNKYFSEIINHMPIGCKDVISKYRYECLLKSDGLLNMSGREGSVLLPEMIPLVVAPGGCALDRKRRHPQMLPPAQPACLFHLIQGEMLAQGMEAAVSMCSFFRLLNVSLHSFYACKILILKTFYFTTYQIFQGPIGVILYIFSVDSTSDFTRIGIFSSSAISIYKDWSSRMSHYVIFSPVYFFWHLLTITRLICH